jgi:molybdopterin-guanine dinucleotide biosynthesis protein
MRIIGLAGWSGSGKTTLVTGVIPVLVGRGLKVATVKHAHHEFDTDQPARTPGCTAAPAPAKSPSSRAGAGPSCMSSMMSLNHHSPTFWRS